MGQIDLPRRFNLQTSPRDLEFRTFMNQLYRPPVNHSPYYPQSPYGMGGLRGNCSIPGPPYCTDMTYDQLLQMFGVENCTTYDAAGDVQGSYDCTQRNFPKLYGPTNSVSAWQQGCCDAGQPPVGTVIPFTPATPTGYSGPVIYQNSPSGPIPLTSDPTTWNGGTGFSTPLTAPTGGAAGTALRFQGSRPNTSQFQIGDSWTLQISGPANTPVSVVGVHNGVSNTNSMGSTDASGNWSMSGTFDSSVLGTWTETWYVGSQQAGSFSFSVVQTASAPNTPPPPTQQPATGGGTPASYPTPQTSGGTPYQAPPPLTYQPPTGSSQPPATSQPVPAGSSAFPNTILGVPTNYVMLGGAALLLLALMGGRR